MAGVVESPPITGQTPVQGLLGTTVFSGDQDRSILTIDGIGGGKTLSGYKASTSLIGALRAGIPAQLFSTWSGNQEHAFHEGGNSNFKLKYKSRQTNFIQTELGLKVAYPFAVSKTEQIPSLRLAWLGDWDMNNEGPISFLHKRLNWIHIKAIKMVRLLKLALTTPLPTLVLGA